MAFNQGPLLVFMACLFLVSGGAMAASIGTMGAVASQTLTSPSPWTLTSKLTPLGTTPKIVFQDSGVSPTTIASTDPVWLVLNAGAGCATPTPQANDVLLAPGSLGGTAGSVLTSPASASGGSFFCSIGGTDLTTLLYYYDTQPCYSGGLGVPDGNYHPGDPLWLDADNDASHILGSNDIILSPGTLPTSLSGCASTVTSTTVPAAGSRVAASTTILDNVWSNSAVNAAPVAPGLSVECVYQWTGSGTAPSAVPATSVETLSDNGGACGTLGGAPVAGQVGVTWTPISNIYWTPAGGTASSTFPASPTTGQRAFLKTTAGSTVTAGDLRLWNTGAALPLTNSKYGIPVLCDLPTADTDCAAPTTALTNTYVTVVAHNLPFVAAPGTTASIKFLDARGIAPAYTAGDPLMLDIDQNGFVGQQELRLNSITGMTSSIFGTTPQPGDPGANVVLSTVSPVTPTILFQSSGTTVTSTTPLALHFGGGSTLGLGDVRLTAAGACPAGSQVKATDTCDSTTAGTWQAISAVTSPGVGGSILYVDNDGSGTFSRGDTLFLHFGGGATGTLSVGDFILSPLPGGTTAGTYATASGGSGVNTLLGAGAIPPIFAFSDLFKRGAYGPGDQVYVPTVPSPGTPGPGAVRSVRVADLRMHNQFSLTPFTFVSETTPDKDATYNLLPVAAPATGAGAWVDSGTGNVRASAIYLLVKSVPTACAPGGAGLSAGDVRLSANPSSLAAGLVLTGTTDVGLSCSTTIPGGVVPPRFAYLASLGASFTTNIPASGGAAPLYYDVDGSGTVSVGDIRIATVGTSLTPGSKVQAGDIDCCGSALTAIAGSKITFADVHGTGVYQSDDPIVLDMDAGGTLSAADVLVTGTGGSTTLIGASPPPPPPPPTNTATTTATTTTTTSTTSSTSSSSSTTSTSTSSSTTTSVDLGQADQALQASMKVVHGADGNNVVTWTTQAGVAGYQVWSHNSPWALVATVDTSTNTLVQKAPASTHYLVTAFTSDATKLTDINTQAVPGLGVNPTGPAADGSAAASASSSASKTKGPIPGPELGLGLAALAVALVVARRRRA